MDTNTLLATIIVALIGAIPAIMAQRNAWKALMQSRENAVETREIKLASLDAKDIASQTKDLADRINVKTDEIQNRTNGHLTELTTQLEAAYQKIGDIVTTLAEQRRRGRATDIPAGDSQEKQHG